MTQEKTSGFKGRAFISTTTGLSFVGMCVTGIILFIVPPGRIANWTGWTIFGLTKAQWQGLHIWFSLVFMVAACVHLYYNWRALLSYFKGKISKTLALRWEWVLSLVVCAIITVGTLADVKPFSSLLAWNEALKYRWDDTQRRAPIPHAELLTLTELAEHTRDVTLETIMANLTAHGITVESPDEVVGELAAAHHLTPAALYRFAVGPAHTGPGRGGGSGGEQGIGRMTLKEYCTSAGIEVGTAIEKLRQARLTASESSTLREIADTGSLHPSQVRQLLE
ncbi:MAG: DUF4405 domain-containing protein [Planctomycetota bacterium]|jgi:hypothetical protein